MRLEKRHVHALFAFAVLAVGGASLGFRFFVIHAQTPDITATIVNDPPSIVAGTTKVCDNSTPIANNDTAISTCSNLSTITLNAGQSTDISLFAKARDNNQNSQIPSGPFAGALYHNSNSDTGTENCSNDENDCYQLSCYKVVDISGGGNTDAWIRCDVSLEYFADHSDGGASWIGYVEVEDISGATADNGGSYSTEISKLISGTFPVVDFGSRDPGDVTGVSDNIAIEHQNNGNVLIDILVGMNDDDADQSLDCHSGSVSDSNIKFDLSDVDFATSAYTLQSVPSTVEMDIDVLQRTNDPSPVINDLTGDIKHSYWNATVPLTGASGFCEEELEVTIFEGP